MASRVARLEQDREEGSPWWAGLPFDDWPPGAVFRFIREVEGWTAGPHPIAEQWRALLGPDDDEANREAD